MAGLPTKGSRSHNSPYSTPWPRPGPKRLEVLACPQSHGLSSASASECPRCLPPRGGREAPLGGSLTLMPAACGLCLVSAWQGSESNKTIGFRAQGPKLAAARHLRTATLLRGCQDLL